MDMDDPWGSPWADEIQHPVIATRVNDDEGSHVRPKTPVKASTLGPEVKADSPWGDDDDHDDNDGFEEWAAVPMEEEARGNGLGHDGAGDTWESRDTGDTRDNESLAKIEENGLPKSWNDDGPSSDDAEQKFAPTLMPNSAATVRMPSPGPWGNETTLNSEEHIGDPPGMEGYRPAVENKEESIDEEIHGVSEPLPGTHVEPLAELLPEPAMAMSEVNETEESDVGKLSLDGQEAGLEPAEVIDETVNAPDMGHESSRPSSSPSDHDEILPESPRTSLDEEPSRPQTWRKVSSKIRGLVEHFDGLGRQEEDNVIQPSRNRSRSETPSLREEKIVEEFEEPADEAQKEEDDDDFGDFEGGQSEGEAAFKDKVERPVTPPLGQNQTTLRPESKMGSPQDSPSRSRYVKKDFGRVEYAIDTSTLEKLVSKSAGDPPKDAAVEKAFIMDSIPYDSFHSLEERKTWYRISRYGSMRKHNSGDDENYIRVTWPQSQTREQTLKTVARWMEEDRISGHVVLGGGSKGSSIFGWNDPNAPAVPLASAFAAKQGRKLTPFNTAADTAAEVPREWPKGLVRDRSTSNTRSPPKANRRSSTKGGSISESHKKSSQAPVANFGWNTSPTSAERSAIPLSKDRPKAALFVEKSESRPPQSASIVSQSLTSNILAPMNPIESKISADMIGMATSSASKPSIVAMPTRQLIASNEDDEWGEMVESPVLSTAPVLPISQGLRHKKSQSLKGSFSPQQPSPLDLPISPLSSTRGHKSTMSFDDILVPSSSVDLKSDPLPTTTFRPVPTGPSFHVPPSPATSVTSNFDPWASADFSFFDLPAPAPVLAPVAPVRAPVSKPMPMTVSFAKALPAPSPLRHGKTLQQIEQDEIVASIVRSLPDLSYMMHR